MLQVIGNFCNAIPLPPVRRSGEFRQRVFETVAATATVGGCTGYGCTAQGRRKLPTDRQIGIPLDTRNNANTSRRAREFMQARRVLLSSTGRQSRCTPGYFGTRSYSVARKNLLESGCTCVKRSFLILSPLFPSFFLSLSFSSILQELSIITGNIHTYPYILIKILMKTIRCENSFCLSRSRQ